MKRACKNNWHSCVWHARVEKTVKVTVTKEQSALRQEVGHSIKYRDLVTFSDVGQEINQHTNDHFFLRSRNIYLHISKGLDKLNSNV